MRIEQLRYIVEIADTGSISKASEKLYVSQPTISQSVAKVEKELRIIIFKRTKFGTEPTENGNLVIEKAREILKLLKGLENLTEVDNSKLTGTLSVASNTTMCMTLIPKTLIAFKSIFPKINIELIEDGSFQINEYVLKDKVDLGLVSRRQTSDFSSALFFEPLLEGKLMACVNKNSIFSNRKSISIQEIISKPIVMCSTSHRANPHILTLLKQYGQPNILFTTGNAESVKLAIVEGTAIGFYQDIALKTDPYVLNGDIIPIDILEETTTNFGILYRKENCSLPTLEFIKQLKTQSKCFKKNNMR